MIYEYIISYLVIMLLYYKRYYYRMESVRAAFRGSGEDDETLIDGVCLYQCMLCWLIIPVKK